MEADAIEKLETHLDARLDAGDLAEVATLVVRNYGPELLGYLGTLLRDDEEVREAFAVFGEELWRALPRFERRSTLRTFCYSIAYHAALRLRRAGGRRRTRPLRDSEYSKIADTVRATSRSFMRTEADEKLAALRRSLDADEQTLLVLRIDRGMSWQEIAAVLGEAPSTGPAALRKRFQRLKDRLRTSAEREGLVRKRER